MYFCEVQFPMLELFIYIFVIYHAFVFNGRYTFPLILGNDAQSLTMYITDQERVYQEILSSESLLKRIKLPL